MKDLNKSTFGLYLSSFFCMKIDALTYGVEMTERENPMRTDAVV